MSDEATHFNKRPYGDRQDFHRVASRAVDRSGVEVCPGIDPEEPGPPRPIQLRGNWAARVAQIIDDLLYSEETSEQCKGVDMVLRTCKGGMTPVMQGHLGALPGGGSDTKMAESSVISPAKLAYYESYRQRTAEESEDSVTSVKVSNK